MAKVNEKPFYFQSATHDCVPASVMAMAQFYGIPINIKQLRSVLVTDPVIGTTLKNINNLSSWLQVQLGCIVKKKEIGLHLAFGAKPIHIFAQLLFESVLISFIGTIGGMLFGTLASFIMLVKGIPQSFTVMNFIQAFVLGTVLGVLFGIYPSLFAAKIVPIRAIKE